MKKALKTTAAVLLAVMVLSFVSCDDLQIQSDETVVNTTNTEVSTETEIESSVQDQTSQKETNQEQSNQEEIKQEQPEQNTDLLMSYEITDCRARTWTNSIGSVWLQTIVEITNTGTTNLYLSSGAYDLEDNLGNLITSRTMVSAYPNVLAPGEKGYMYDEATLDENYDGELTVLPREDIEESRVDLIRFTVTDTKISNDKYGRLKMVGRVENSSKEEQTGMIYIVAFLYDNTGSFVGQMSTILTEDLAVGDKIGFEMSEFSLPDDITAEIVTDYVIYAYPLQYQF
ncbi:MAG: hypothetical protein J6D42_07265 [Clostridia bacterium]|nr:hypothetical protein [Clostridia bacterium]